MRKNSVRLISSIAFLLLVVTAFGQQKQNEKILNYLDGRKFYAFLGESCSETTGGDFMETSHCILIFDKSKVNVKRYVNKNRSYERRQEPKGDVAAYVIKDDTIIVEGQEFLSLIIDTTKNYQNNWQLRIFTPFNYFNPKGKRIYFVELDKKTNKYSAPYNF